MPSSSTIRAVVVGYGLAGRVFHVPLINRQEQIELAGVVVRDAGKRFETERSLGVRGYSSLDEALRDDGVDLIVVATPHDSHAELVTRSLSAGKHCVVDKVMALRAEDCDRMIEARDAAGRMLSVFHNRRWDWDYATLRSVLAAGSIGRPLIIESSVCRYSAPRSWRGDLSTAGTILHDWGAHLVDQVLLLGLGPCRRLTAWLADAPWPGVTTGGHGRIVMEFEGVVVQVETSRICRLDRPRWWVLGSAGGFTKHGIDPQEEALRAGNLEAAAEPAGSRGVLRVAGADGATVERSVEAVRASWDGFYAGIASHLLKGAALEVTAEQGREVVRVLEAAVLSIREGRGIDGAWGADAC